MVGGDGNGGDDNEDGYDKDDSEDDDGDDNDSNKHDGMILAMTMIVKVMRWDAENGLLL